MNAEADEYGADEELGILEELHHMAMGQARVMRDAIQDRKRGPDVVRARDLLRRLRRTLRRVEIGLDQLERMAIRGELQEGATDG